MNNDYIYICLEINSIIYTSINYSYIYCYSKII